MLYRGPVCQASQKQTLVTTLSTKSKYITLLTRVKQVVQIRQVIRDIGFPDYIRSDLNSINIKGDN